MCSDGRLRAHLYALARSYSDEVWRQSKSAGATCMCYSGYALLYNYLRTAGLCGCMLKAV